MLMFMKPMQSSVRKPQPFYGETDMPLIKSTGKEAFKKNVSKEVAAGKPSKQAIAIAYSVKREAAKPAKRGK